MYGWSGFGILGRDNPTADMIGGRYAVEGIVRTGGAADSDLGRVTDFVIDQPAVDTAVPPTSSPKAPIVISSSGAASSSAVTILPVADAGFFSSLPWWAWLGAAGLGAYALKKGGR